LGLQPTSRSSSKLPSNRRTRAEILVIAGEEFVEYLLGSHEGGQLIAENLLAQCWQLSHYGRVFIEAAAQLEFEKAAALRDEIAKMRKL